MRTYYMNKSQAVKANRQRCCMYPLCPFSALEKFVDKLLEAMKDKEELLKRVNKRGETALDVALANEEITIAKKLQQYGLAEHEETPEYTCLICSSLLYEPCTLSCGHTFCMYCGTASVKPETGGLCPFRCNIRTTSTPQKNLRIEKEIKEKYPEHFQRREAAFFKQRANACLQDFARVINPGNPLKFNENNTVHITHEDIDLRVTLLRRELYVYHVLHKVLSCARLHLLLGQDVVWGGVCFSDGRMSFVSVAKAFASTAASTALLRSGSGF